VSLEVCWKSGVYSASQEHGRDSWEYTCLCNSATQRLAVHGKGLFEPRPSDMYLLTPGILLVRSIDV
jgi:hypothetical protein